MTWLPKTPAAPTTVSIPAHLNVRDVKPGRDLAELARKAEARDVFVPSGRTFTCRPPAVEGAAGMVAASPEQAQDLVIALNWLVARLKEAGARLKDNPFLA